MPRVTDVRLFDFPRQLPREAYDDALSECIAVLQRDPAVLAVYGFGAVSAPGISDLDVLAVIEDGQTATANPLASLSRASRYLFTHAPFAISRGLFARAVQMFPADRLDVLWRRDGFAPDLPSHDGLSREIARQTAFEYLIANYIIRKVEARYQLASVRSVLLSSYALRHDFTLLGDVAGPVAELVQRIGDWRRRWFHQPVSGQEISNWFVAFLDALSAFLQDRLERHPVALPSGYRASYARHIRIVSGPSLGARHRGVVLPAALGRFGRRFVRAQHRFNRFQFTIPAVCAAAGSAIENRFDLFRLILSERRQRYPQFAALATPWVNLL